MKSNLIKLLRVVTVVVLLFGASGQADTLKALAAGNSAPSAMPASATDETKVPHYFGPYPNWANSPFTLPDAQVVISGNGTGATAVATVGANGSVTDITITNPGHNYSNAKVDILGSGTGALADVIIVKKGAVVSVIVEQAGTGYSAPIVTFSTGGSGGGAMGAVYGGVENNIQVVNGGSGYSFPTVDFDLPDGPNGVQAQGHATMDGNGTITAIIVDSPGSGYSTAPNVVVRDGTIFDPIMNHPNGFAEASVTATLSIQEIVLDTFGSGYTSAPTVDITDPTGTGALATAALDNGIISAIILKKAGLGYVTAGGIKKFTDPLPGLCAPPACPASGKYIPLAVPAVKTYNGVDADEYVIGLVQYRTSFSSSLPPTLVRGYVQLETADNAGISQHYAVQNELLDGTKVDTGWFAVTPPQYLGPIIAATKDRPVRVVFHNLLPVGADGDLFLPADSTLMGSGMGPMEMMPPMDMGSVMDEIRNPHCSEFPKDALNCFADNRATLHLHGGNSPWISDGTPHQWITPAGESTMWPQGVSVQNVPDMDVCGPADDGCQTFYYTNQQSARLMFYHDHSWGITRLNVYAGEAAGYLITDSTEQTLINSGTIPGATDTIPLVIQDKTFVPDAAQLALQDPTWDTARWGTKGSFWYHHVYMPAQNPGDPSGMSAYGRWMYGPWFWPPAANTMYGPIANPYYDPNCNLDDSATWQYQTDPFCEPAQIPGTPNISVGMEQFNDTPIVNGIAYPTLTLQPKTYRLRILSAANDRFFNFQWYVGDAATASADLNSQGQVIGETEVALNPAELAAAQLDPNVFPTPIQGTATTGPDWIQIGTEGGFLPAPVVVDGQQPTTWITDPTRFDVGNVDKHSLLLAPAERADVIVDFSKFAGKTLILYNDAPAAFPARVSSYDYYTGAPDLSPIGAPSVLPGYGPNTRTIMQVKIAGSAAPAFNLSKLQAAFRHNANGTGVFESGQPPIIVGQAAYNSAYGAGFASGSNCNVPGNIQRCDGYVRVNDTSVFGFNTLKAQSVKMTMPLQPKAIHDEMNSSTFDEFGRMQANLGLEAQPPTPGAQNVVLYPYTASPTELIDGTNLPKADVKVTPISSADDGSQIWRVTHNGVDTHPIHFHLYDVQVVNRVTWDNIIIPPDANELGWKDTVRIAPLEDTIVALRPIIPQVPFDLPNSVHELSPMMPDGAELSAGLIADPQGNPVQLFNHLVNFGWEYVYHCHILSHEEMDMMRPVLLALPPVVPNGVAFDIGTNTLFWNDNSLSETAFVIEKSSNGTDWVALGRVNRLLSDVNTAGEVVSYLDTQYNIGDQYRVFAENTIGDTQTPGFPMMTVKSAYAYVETPMPPAAPSNLTATLKPDLTIDLAWTDNSTNETGFVLERSVDGVTFLPLAILAGNTVSYTDTAVLLGDTYTYQVKATNIIGDSPYSNQAVVSVPSIPLAPSALTAAAISGTQVDLAWTDNADNEDGFVVERSLDGINWSKLAQTAANATSYSDTAVLPLTAYSYRVYAFNISGSSLPSDPAAATTPDVPPAAPNNLVATLRAGPQIGLTWTDNSNNESNFVVERSTDGVNFSALATVAANTASYVDVAVANSVTYTYRVAATNAIGTSAYAVSAAVTTPAMAAPARPTNLTATNLVQTSLTLNWQDNSNNEDGFTVQIATNNGFTAGLQTFTVAINVTAYDFTGLNPNTRYYFRVAAFNAGGSSQWSPVFNVRTPR